MDPQELTRLIREKQSNLDGKRMVKGIDGVQYWWWNSWKSSKVGFSDFSDIDIHNLEPSEKESPKCIQNKGVPFGFQVHIGNCDELQLYFLANAVPES